MADARESTLACEHSRSAGCSPEEPFWETEAPVFLRRCFNRYTLSSTRAEVNLNREKAANRSAGRPGPQRARNNAGAEISEERRAGNVLRAGAARAPVPGRWLALGPVPNPSKSAYPGGQPNCLPPMR
jgi:hypothetical protein